ncbi:hypothetical protein ABZ613_10300 [Streptomyces collinus]|uniref:hypothetical protein n=1 Tax=Streptomyces collinus TaxID=42684 RepID=UPI0033D7834C
MPSDTEKVQFAAVLAQVIPVAILAVVVEARSGHVARAEAIAAATPAPATPAQPGPWWRRALRALWRTMGGQPAQTREQVVRDLVIEAIVLTFLVFVEMSALMTAAGSNTSVLNWFAGRPGAIGVGVLLVLVGQLYIDNLAETYRTKGPLGPTEAKIVKTIARILLWCSIILAVGAVVVFYT